nr:lantibiotic dehydratase [Bacillus subtilis]
MNTKYLSSDLFMYRKPILDLSFYKECLALDNEFNEEEYIAKISNLLNTNPTIAEAIYFASEPLYNSFLNIEKLKKKKRKSVIDSMLKFLIRMSTRPTPFGLFSGIGVETFSGQDEYLTKDSEVIKNTRLDMCWIYFLIRKLESNLSILEQLTVENNSLVYNHGDRIKLSYQSLLHSDDNDQSLEMLTLRKTAVMDYVYSQAEFGINYSTLRDSINKTYSVTDDISNDFLNSLLKNEVIITNLRTSLVNSDPFENILNIISKMHNVEEELNYLVRLKKSIEEYKKSSGELGISILKKIKKEMRVIGYEGDDFLRTDLYYVRNKKRYINNNQKDSIEKLAEILSLLGSVNSFQPLEAYRDEFIDKYGIFQEVPLLELIDEELGIGLPPEYHENRHKPSQPEPSNEFHRIKNIISSWQAEVSLSKNHEIKLDDEKIKHLFNSEELNNIAVSQELELYFNILLDEHKENKLYLNPNCGSNSLFQTYGRFKYFLGESDKEYIKQFSHIEKDVIFAEVTYYPTHGKTANIINAETCFDYEIAFSCNSSKDNKHSIALSDLYVGSTYNFIYLKSKKLDKIIIPKLSHMFNYSMVPKVYRFLVDIGVQYQKQWSNIDSFFYDAPIKPRVIYNNIVLSPKKWNLNKSIIPFECDSGEKFHYYIKDWKKRYKVPDFIYLIEFDNKLLLNLENISHIKIIYNEFKKLSNNQSLHFLEAEKELFNNHNNEIEEYVFTLKSKLHQLELDSYMTNIQSKIPFKYIGDNERLKFLGTEWIYVKLYGLGTRENEFIADELGSFIKKHLDKGTIKSSFFIRYSDPKQHLRVRFKVEKNNIFDTVLPIIIKWLEEMRTKGFVNYYCFDPYNPEIERYGGEQSYKIAEDLFFCDSLIVSEWIQINRSGNVNIDEVTFGVFNILQLLKLFNLNIEEQMTWLEINTKPQKYANKFRGKKSTLIELADLIYTNKKLDKYNKISSIIEIREKTAITYSKSIENNPDFLIKNIIMSVIHMHCNRLYGINRDKENLVIGLAYHTIKNYNNALKYNNVLIPN